MAMLQLAVPNAPGHQTEAVQGSTHYKDANTHAVTPPPQHPQTRELA